MQPSFTVTSFPLEGYTAVTARPVPSPVKQVAGQLTESEFIATPKEPGKLLVLNSNLTYNSRQNLTPTLKENKRPLSLVFAYIVFHPISHF